MRIVIAEDDPLLREGLALLLRAEGLDVVATAGTPDEALDAIDVHKPDVAILDVRMPPTHSDEGIVAAVEARRRRRGRLRTHRHPPPYRRARRRPHPDQPARRPDRPDRGSPLWPVSWGS